LTMAYQAFSFLVCLLAASVLWGLLSRKKFSAERILPKFGTVGSPLPYRIAIQNKGGSVQRGLILAENLPDPQPQGENRLEPAEKKRNWFDHGGVNDRALWSVTKNRSAEAGQLSLPALAPYAETEVYHQLVPSKRGTLRLSGMTIFWPDPFGLFRSLSKIKCSQSVLILPKRYFLPPFELPGTMKYQHGGVALASSVGESEEFVALRDYRPGDPPRRIHWKSWAKSGKPIVTEYQDEFFVRHALILDTFTEEEGDLFEEAVSVAASFACTIPGQDSLLDLMFVIPQAFCFTAGRGLAYPEQMLEILASVSPCRDKALASLQQLMLQHIGAVSGAICVLLAWNEERKDLVEQLRVMGIPTVVLLITAAGDANEMDLGPLADQPQNFYRLEAGRIAEGLAQL